MDERGGAPLLGRRKGASRRRRGVLIVCSFLAAACCLSVASSWYPNVRTLLVGGRRSVAEMEREASLVRAENHKLRREDNAMVAQKQLMEHSLLEQQKAAKLRSERAKLNAERMRRHALEQRNARLSLENQELQHSMLAGKVEEEKREVQSMKQLSNLQVEVDDATKAMAASISRREQTLSAVSTPDDVDADEGVGEEGGLDLGGHQTTGLVGDYIARCEPGHGCEKFYRPENLTHYAAHNHTIAVTSNGIGWPLGPVERVAATSYMKSVHDIIPKEGRVPHSGHMSPGSLGSHWITMGAKDAFVPFNSSNLNSRQYRLLPPWTRRMIQKEMGMSFDDKAAEEEDAEVAGLEKVQAKDIHGSCPGDATGRSCLSGSTGVDGVHEWNLLSHGKSWNTRWLEKQGVNVGEWGIPGVERHRWSRAGEDDPPGEAYEVDWKGMKTPQWSWNNNAMKSQGWDPEGVMNRQLVLGGGFGPGNVSKTDVLDDEYVNQSGYAGQVQVEASEHPHDDHFANWEPSSSKNIKLLFGDSAVTNDMRWSIKRREWVPTQWGWGDSHIASTEAVKELRSLELPRTGEPFGDWMGAKWSGANGVDANSYNIQDAPNKTEAYTVKTKLANLGVNV